MVAHNERCRDCKKAVKDLLLACYGAVEVNWDLGQPCKIEQYLSTPFGGDLKKIYSALQRYRGFDEFVKARRLPRVDFYIPKQSLIIEFDESQHFTVPRAITLGLYPDRMRLGFSVARWRTLSQTLSKRDNDPPYRDEQRAWYDTLRDFAPLIVGRGRVMRLYARDITWCSLDPKCRADLSKFKAYLHGD